MHRLKQETFCAVFLVDTAHSLEGAPLAVLQAWCCFPSSSHLPFDRLAFIQTLPDKSSARVWAKFADCNCGCPNGGGGASLCSSLKSQHQGCWIYPQNNLCADSSEKLKETRCENSPGKHFRARSSRKAFASLRGAPEGQEIKPLHQMSFAQPECLKPLLFAGKRPSQSSEHWQEKPAPAQVGGQIQQEQRTRPQTFCLLATQF